MPAWPTGPCRSSDSTTARRSRSSWPGWRSVGGLGWPIGRSQRLPSASGPSPCCSRSAAIRPSATLVRRLPIVGLLRCPSRYIVLFHLATAVLAAVGFADLSGILGRGEIQPWRRLWPLALLPAVSLLLGRRIDVAGRVPARRRAAIRLAPAREVFLGPLWLALATTAVLAAARGRRLALVAVVAVAASDMALYGVEKIFHRSPPMTVEALIACEPAPPGRPTRRVRGGSNLLTMSGFDLADGYLALTPRRMLDYDRVSALRVAGIGWSRSRRGPARWAPCPTPCPRPVSCLGRSGSDDPGQRPRADRPRVDRAARLRPATAGRSAGAGRDRGRSTGDGGPRHGRRLSAAPRPRRQLSRRLAGRDRWQAQPGLPGQWRLPGMHRRSRAARGPLPVRADEPPGRRVALCPRGGPHPGLTRSCGTHDAATNRLRNRCVSRILRRRRSASGCADRPESQPGERHAIERLDEDDGRCLRV